MTNLGEQSRYIFMPLIVVQEFHPIHHEHQNICFCSIMLHKFETLIMSHILSFIPTISLIVQKTSFQKYEFELINIWHEISYFMLFNFHKIQSNLFQYHRKRMEDIKIRRTVYNLKFTSCRQISDKKLQIKINYTLKTKLFYITLKKRHQNL